MAKVCRCGRQVEKGKPKKDNTITYKKICRTCRGRTINVENSKRISKEYYQNNKEKEFAKSKIWRENNPSKVIAYNIMNREKRNQYCKDRLKIDINYRITKYLRARLYNAVKNNQKTGSAIKDLGCSVEELKKHLENNFYPNPSNMEDMTWNNYGEWHIDHIKPLASSNLSNPEEIKAACHYMNLQPLWAKDNLKKSNKYTEENE